MDPNYFSCNKCSEIKNAHFRPYFEHMKSHLKNLKKGDNVKCFCFETINSLPSYFRHFVQKHKDLNRKYISVFRKNKGKRKPQINIFAVDEQLKHLSDEEYFENELQHSTESVLAGSKPFLNDILKFKLENNLEHSVFCGLAEKFLTFFEQIKHNPEKESIISCVRDRLACGRSIERYIRSLPNFVEPEQFIYRPDDDDKVYRYHMVDIKKVLNNLVSNEDIFYELFLRPSK